MRPRKAEHFLVRTKDKYSNKSGPKAAFETDKRLIS